MDLFRRLGECRETRSARKHIDRIRNENKSQGRKSEKESLDDLSSQLYPTPTHIIQQLILNADDTHYDSVKPTLTFTYKKGHLRIDWNNRGLTAQDVDAICSIGNRQVQDRPIGGFISHKGIGFQSVFNTADQVWIRSRAYSFKLNRAQSLGAFGPLIPEWASFPQPSSEKGTSMYLSLSNKESETEIIEQLEAFEPKTLLFLRKIRLLRIKITRDDGTVDERELHRHDYHGDGHYTTTLQSGDSSETFLVFRSMRDTASRDGSETQLAFPIDSNDQAIVETQKVYRILPTKDYGFKFCIQANFPLIPDFADLWSDPKDDLFYDILDVFERAVEYFLAHDQYRMTWLKYLSFGPHQEEYFDKLEESIMQRLREKPILRSETRDLARARDLFFVPSNFRGDDGAPLTLCEDTASMYLSREYLPDDWPLLESLGVSLLRVEDFVDQLSYAHRSYQDHGPEALQWHFHVARAIVQQEDRQACIPKLRQMRLIPLRSGRWCSAVEGNLFLPSTLGHSIPEGFGTLEVHPEVTHDKERMYLMGLLGVRLFDATMIQQIVTEKLVTPRQAMTLLDEQLIKGAAFLHATGWSNTSGADLHVATDQDRRPHPASSVYLPSKSPYSASELLKERKGTFFLQQGYFSTDVTDEIGWRTWLSTNLGISEIPKLETRSAEGTVSLSDDFAFLIENARLVDWLRVLRIHYQQNASYLKNGNIRTALQSTMVPCHGGAKYPLRDTYLPYADLIGHGKSPFLRIPLDGEDWSFLELLGVSVKRDTSFCTRLLKHVQGGDPSQVQLHALYRDIAQTSDETLRNVFINNDLIYIPMDGDGALDRWISLSECVWDGPNSLVQTPRIGRIYPNLAPLFRDILQIPNATPETLLREIEGLAPGGENAHAFALFQDVDTLVHESSSPLSYKAWQTRKIFPVVNVDGSHSMRSMDDQSGWLVANSEYHRRAFDRQIPLLALPVEMVSKLPTLSNLWGLHKRVLSEGVGFEINQYEYDEGALDKDCTEQTREKVGLIARLIPENESASDKIGLIAKTEIYRCDEITIQWIIRTQHKDVRSHPMPGHAHARRQDGGIRIYIHQDHLARECFPLEFFEELEWLLRIEHKHRHLLQLIFNHEDQEYLHDALDKNGAPRSRRAVAPLLEGMFGSEDRDFFYQEHDAADGESDSASSVASSRPQTPADVQHLVGPSGVDARKKHTAGDMLEPTRMPIE